MENPGQESSDQVNVDPAPSPHFVAEPLNMVVPETNPDSEEDANDWLQQKEALEFALKKNKRRRRLVKDGKVVQAEEVPVVNVDEETKEEPSSLSRKSSRKKHSLSEKHTSKGAESSSKSHKTVRESGDKSDEEEVEKSSEHRQNKSVEKHKCSYRRSVICSGSCTPNFRNAIVKDKAAQHGEQVHKKTLLPVYQLLFEMVNKVLLPCAERRFVASKADLFLMETLDNFSSINLPAVMIEHLQKVENLKNRNPGMPYRFLLTKCECVDKVGGIGSTSTISQLINAQNSATEEIRKLKARNTILENQLSQLQEVPGSSGSHSAEVARLTKENAELRKQVEDLKERLLNEQLSANARMDLVLQTLASSSKPPSSSVP
ncbi:PREDICTED: A-kinase anchor protein 9-like [Nicotiana attenuata]|uniref:A-kinase anchor protein 9-like n=1 Tax=Nicotiana attenuata TaxID=49451 RepID=UPI000905B843|nr:PREDICTED: A-kinase anchor protein 9-like [Nicotiana attenuata]